MGVVARFGKTKAMLRDGEWISADPSLEAELNRVMEAWISSTGGPPLKSSDPEREAAEEVCHRMGGKILGHAEANGRSSARIYFERRQMKLGFDE